MRRLKLLSLGFWQRVVYCLPDSDDIVIVHASVIVLYERHELFHGDARQSDHVPKAVVPELVFQ